MSHGCDICPNCGGEVKTFDGYGGTCPNCGHWVSAGIIDSTQMQLDRERKEEEIRRKRIEHAIRIEVYCTENDDDRIREWSKEFTNIEDARDWARRQSGCTEFIYYDENGRID